MSANRKRYVVGLFYRPTLQFFPERETDSRIWAEVLMFWIGWREFFSAMRHWRRMRVTCLAQ